MKAVLVLVFLALATSAFAGCDNSAATQCGNTYDACVTFGSSAEPTCECSVAFRTCMTTAGCCSTANTSDACDTRCNSNCGNPTCTWPPTLADDCAFRATCLQLNQCSNTDCKCEVGLRQCLLFQGCSYDSTLSSSCTSDCNSRTPRPDCSAKAATVVAPTPTPVGCVAVAPYIQTGDCSCRDDIRAIAPAATCASGTWTVAGPFTLAQTLTLQYDTVNVNGDFTVGTNGNLAFSFAANSDSGRVTVTGTATIQGSVNVEILNTDGAAKTITLLTAATVSVPNAASSLKIPTLGATLCFISRQYATTTTQVDLQYRVSTNPQDCIPTTSPAGSPTLSTNGAAPRPSPVKYTPPPGSDSASTLGLFASVAILVASFAGKLL